jgi:hypothetical protein
MTLPAFSVASRFGSPAQMNGMKAHWFCFFRVANVSGMDTVLTALYAAASVAAAARVGAAVDRRAAAGREHVQCCRCR